MFDDVGYLFRLLPKPLAMIHNKNPLYLMTDLIYTTTLTMVISYGKCYMIYAKV